MREMSDLFGDSLLHTKELVQATLLDLLQESGSNVHVGIKRRFPSRKLWQSCDSSLEMSSVGGQISGTSSAVLCALYTLHDLHLSNVVHVADTR